MKQPLLLIICACVFVITFALAWLLPTSNVQQQATVAQARYFGPTVTDTAEAVALASQVRGMVIQHYDHELALLHRFEVRRKDGEWVIPSHHSYPADGGDRVGRTAGSVLGVERRPGSLETTRPSDHARLGVLAPDDDQAPFGSERGKRITLTGAQGETMLDVIIGHQVDERSGWYYMREASDDAVYRVQMQPDLSTRFTDYVERDLLGLKHQRITEIAIDPHRVDEQAGNVITPAKTILRRQGTSNQWSSQATPSGQSVDVDAVRGLLDGITGVRLQGVRPLQPVTMERMMRFGFFSNDGATIWGSEGALEVQHQNGLRYTLYFGNRAPDDGMALTAGLDEEEPATSGDNRYMIILVNYDRERDRQLQKQLDQARANALDALPEGQEALDDAAEQALQEELRDIRNQRRSEMNDQREAEQAKFLKFFYVISGSIYDDLRPDVDSLFSAADEEAEAGSDPQTIVPPAQP